MPGVALMQQLSNETIHMYPVRVSSILCLKQTSGNLLSNTRVGYARAWMVITPALYGKSLQQ